MPELLWTKWFFFYFILVHISSLWYKPFRKLTEIKFGNSVQSICDFELGLPQKSQKHSLLHCCKGQAKDISSSLLFVATKMLKTIDRPWLLITTSDCQLKIAHSNWAHKNTVIFMPAAGDLTSPCMQQCMALQQAGRPRQLVKDRRRSFPPSGEIRVEHKASSSLLNSCPLGPLSKENPSFSWPANLKKLDGDDILEPKLSTLPHHTHTHTQSTLKRKQDSFCLWTEPKQG